MSAPTSKCPTCGTPAVLKEGYLPNPIENWQPVPAPAAVTPLQATALAALKTWRKVGLSFDRTNFDSWPDWHEQWEASEEALRTTADALLATEGGSSASPEPAATLPPT